MKKLLLLTIAAAFSFSLVNAQEKWDLEKCINYAKEHNINLQLQKLNSKIQENDTKQSKLDLLPSVSGSTDYSFRYGRTLNSNNTYSDNNTQGGSLGINAGVTLFNGFQKLNTIKQNQLNLMASLQDVEQEKENLALNITSLYLNILFNKELVYIAQEKLKVTKLQIQRTEALVEAGTLPKGNFNGAECPGSQRRA